MLLQVLPDCHPKVLLKGAAAVDFRLAEEVVVQQPVIEGRVGFSVPVDGLQATQAIVFYELAHDLQWQRMQLRRPTEFVLEKLYRPRSLHGSQWNAAL